MYVPDFVHIKDHVRNRKKATALSQMRRHQDWVRMHADTRLTAMPSDSATAFGNMVKSLIPEAKYEVFMQLLRYPLPSTKVVSVVFDRLSRVFEGRNPVYNYQFEKTEYADDWEWYRQEMLGEPNVWKTKAWDYYRTQPNSVIVVDMPVERAKGDKYRAPYFYWVTVDDILDYDTDDNGKITWIIYKDELRKRVYEVDSEYYRSYPYDHLAEDIKEEGGTENRHGLGYCPAQFFVREPVSLDNPDVKRSPITNALTDLDWYLFSNTSKKHLDVYGSYPIYSGYEPECDYEVILHEGEKEIVQHCEHGIMCNTDGTEVIGADGKPKPCPRCGKHRIAGAGTYIEVPAPVAGQPDMRNPVNILTVDKDSLEYNSENLERQKKEIISMCVGVDGDMLNTFSVSGEQIDANYESQSTILVRVKKVFEEAQAFVDSTICRLRYGDQFVSCSIDYGNEFYTLTTEQLRKRYKEAKDGGATESDLSALRRQIVETEYRTNPLQMQRMLILSDVEPLTGMSRNEALNAYNNGLIDETDMKVKMNFESLMRRFEREQTNIIDFGSGMVYRAKIDKIQQILREYVKDIRVRSDNSSGVSQAPAEEGE